MQPDLAGVTGEVVGQIQDRAQQLGLTWQMVKATVTAVSDETQATILLDGDTVPVGSTTVVGVVTVGDRVWVMVVPPGGLYVVGRAGTAAAISYTPVLFATVSPTLGTGSVTLGRWRNDPFTGWADVQIKFRFGTSGAAAGTGNYNITLPTAMDLQSDPLLDAVPGISDLVGTFAIRDNSTGARAEGYVYPDTPSGAAGTPGEGLGVVQMVVIGGTFVGAASPWTWAASDGIVLTVRYRPAL